MSSTVRSYLVILCFALGAACVFGQSVTAWNAPAIFGIIAVFVFALGNGLAKSPRDAALTDAAAAIVAAPAAASPEPKIGGTA